MYAPAPKFLSEDIDEALIKLNLSIPPAVIGSMEFYYDQNHIDSITFDNLCDIIALQHPDPDLSRQKKKKKWWYPNQTYLVSHQRNPIHIYNSVGTSTR